MTGSAACVTSITSLDVYPPWAGHTLLVRNHPGRQETVLTKGILRRPTACTADATADAPTASIGPGSRAELKKLPDSALLAKVRALPRDSELRAAACEILVDRYQRLVRSCVRQGALEAVAQFPATMDNFAICLLFRVAERGTGTGETGYQL